MIRYCIESFHRICTASPSRTEEEKTTCQFGSSRPEPGTRDQAQEASDWSKRLGKAAVRAGFTDDAGDPSPISSVAHLAGA